MLAVLGIPAIGGLAFGIFVGIVIGFALGHAMSAMDINSKLRVGLIAGFISTALVGQVLAFLGRDPNAKWFYPLGLLLGLAVTRYTENIEIISQFLTNGGKANKFRAIVAGFEITSVAVLTLLAMAIAWMV
jgi:hypothetical protein